MKLYRLLIMVIVLVTAVSCSSDTNNPAPTQVPTAAPLAGPPGTNQLNAPFQSITHQENGYSIEYPQDWTGNNTESAIRLSPDTQSTTSDFENIPVNASLFINTTVDSTTDIVTTLESIISSPEFGPTDSTTRLVSPTAVSINNYEAAMTQITFTPAPIAPPIEEPGEINPETLPQIETYLYMVALQQNDQTVVFAASVPSEYSKDYTPVFESMANTIQIVPKQNEE